MNLKLIQTLCRYVSEFLLKPGFHMIAAIAEKGVQRSQRSWKTPWSNPTAIVATAITGIARMKIPYVGERGERSRRRFSNDTPLQRSSPS